MQSYIFIRCSILEEGSDLNIEIYKESRQKKIMTLGRTLEGDLVCQVNIKFDDLWRHLVSESQKETNVSLSLSRSLPMDSGYLSKFQGRIDSFNLRNAALDRRRGMINFKMKIPIQI